jgi:N-acetylmuramoyl-L-alanine amidase
VFIGLTLGETGSLAYYATDGFESAGGRRLAELLADQLGQRIAVAEPTGMRLPILRETRMPAVLITVPPTAPGERSYRPIAQAVTTSLNQWSRPLD